MLNILDRIPALARQSEVLSLYLVAALRGELTHSYAVAGLIKAANG